MKTNARPVHISRRRSLRMPPPDERRAVDPAVTSRAIQRLPPVEVGGPGRIGAWPRPIGPAVVARLLAERGVDRRRRRRDNGRRIVALRFDLRRHRIIERVADLAEAGDEAPWLGE